MNDMLAGMDLLGIYEITRLLGLSRQRVYQLIESGRFPAPVATLSVGRIWLREDVEKWATERKPLT